MSQSAIATHQGADKLALVTHLLNTQPLLGEALAESDAVVLRWEAQSRQLGGWGDCASATDASARGGFVGVSRL